MYYVQGKFQPCSAFTVTSFPCEHFAKEVRDGLPTAGENQRFLVKEEEIGWRGHQVQILPRRATPFHLCV